MLDAYSEIPGPDVRTAFNEIKYIFDKKSNFEYNFNDKLYFKLNYNFENFINNESFYEYIMNNIQSEYNKHNSLGSYTGWCIFTKNNIVASIHKHIIKYWLKNNNKLILNYFIENDTINKKKHLPLTPRNSKTEDTLINDDNNSNITIEYEDLIVKFIKNINIDYINKE